MLRKPTSKFEESLNEEKIYFSYKGYTLFALRWGQGSQVILAFHGFGQHAEAYHVLKNELEHEFTVYSIEHFHHGRSTYPPGVEKSTPLSSEFYMELLDAFCQSEGIQHYNLMGYSLGGKTVLAYFEHRSESVQGICLLAPDGIIESGWYKMVSRYRLGDFLYRKIIDYPGFFFGLLNILHALRLLNDKLYRFVKGQLSTKGKRRLVFFTWRTYAQIRPNIPNIKEKIRAKGIPALIFTGKFDHVLHPKIGRRFVKNLPENCLHIELESGHDLLRAKNVPLIGESLKVNFPERK